MATKSLYCKCGRKLADVELHQGWTVIRAYTPHYNMVMVKKAVLECVRCGEMREFHSLPNSALRIEEWGERRVFQPTKPIKPPKGKPPEPPP